MVTLPQIRASLPRIAGGYLRTAGGILFCLCLTAIAGSAQSEDILARDNDEQVVQTAERQQVVAALLAAAKQAQSVGENVKAASWLNRAGRVQFRLNLPQEALATYSQALALLRSSPDPATEIDSLNGQSTVLVRINKCDQAEEGIERALLLGRQNGYVKGEAAALLTRSECQRGTDHALALTTAEEALRLFQSIKYRWGIGKAYRAMGEIQLALSRLTESRASLETSLGIWQELALPLEQAQTIIYLGYVEYRKGAWQNSISLLTQAQNLLDENAEPYNLGQITLSIAEALIEAGIPEDGLALLQRAAEYFRRASRKSGVVLSGWEIGRSYYYLGRYPEALAQLERIMLEARELKDDVLVARCEDYLGRSYFALGDFANALTHYQIAIDLFTRAHDQLEVARTQSLVGQNFQSNGQPDRARQQFQLALAIFDKLGDVINQSATLYALGGLELEQGNLEQAHEYLSRSINSTENLRRNSTSFDLTAAFSASVYDRYEKYVELLMRQHAANPARAGAVTAFETSELGRGRSLAELLRQTDTSLVFGLDPQLARRERDLRQLLRAKADQQVEVLGQASYKKEELDALKAELTQLETEYAQVITEIRQRNPAFGEIVQPAAWTLPQIQEQVIADDQTVLLEYSLGDEKSYVWAVTRDGFKSYEFAGRAAIDQAAQAVYSKMSAAPSANNGAELMAAQQELSRLVLAPVAAELNRSRVIVVADGVLNYIPFQSLPDPANTASPLVARLEVINAPSASILGALGKESVNRPRPTKLLAAFGNPAFPSNYAQLNPNGGGELVAANENDPWRPALRDIEIDPDQLDTADIVPLFYSQRELQNLRSVGSGERLIAAEFDATRENVLKSDLSQYSILHFATHGFLDPKRPERSGLVLSTVDRQGKPVNGYLALQDIYALRAPVDLVVLSACRTGLGKDVKGEGLIGLTRGFMYAGASTVVASLWKVDDAATAALMKEFYANLLEKNLAPAAALRAAQNTIRANPRWSSPYYWAAFTIQGDFRAPIRPVVPPAAPGLGKRLLIAVLVLGVLAIVAWRLRKD